MVRFFVAAAFLALPERGVKPDFAAVLAAGFAAAFRVGAALAAGLGAAAVCCATVRERTGRLGSTLGKGAMGAAFSAIAT